MTRLFVCLLLAAQPAHALAQTTWTVDLDPANGADFVEIQPAVDASIPGDVILVGAGDYERFELMKGVRIVGSTDPSDGSPSTRLRNSGPPSLIAGIPSDELVVLADLRWDGDIRIENCDGVVVEDNVVGRHELANLEDLRVRKMLGRVDQQEYVNWAEFGEPRPLLATYTPWFIETGETTDEPSRIHLSNPRVAGASGFSSPSCFGGFWGDGVLAYYSKHADVSISGRPGDYVSGGLADNSGCVSTFGSHAISILEGSIRHSGVELVTGDPVHAPDAVLLGASVVETAPTTPDPSLRQIGEAVPGAALTLAVDGAHGDWARLELGRAPANGPAGISAVPRLVTTGRLFSLGEIPAAGTASLTATIPPSARAGDVYWLQAFTVTPSGEGRRTNSLPIVVRR